MTTTPTTTDGKVEVLHETSMGLDKSQQVYSLVRTVSWLLWDTTTISWQKKKIRMTVHIDSQANQSIFKAEMWSGSEWSLVVSINGQDPKFSGDRIASGYLPAKASQAKVDTLDRIADELLRRAQQVLA